MSEGLKTNSSSSGNIIKRGLSDWPDLVLAVIPILDREYADLIAMIPVLRHLTTWIPGVNPIYLRKEPATWIKNLLLNLGFTADDWLLGTLTAGAGLLLPLDKEAFRWVLHTFGIDFMEEFFNQKIGSQQGSYVDENGEIVMADGGIERKTGDSQGSRLGGFGSLIKKALMIGGPILVVVFLLSSGYFDYGINQVGFQAAGLDVPEIGATLAQGAKTIECVGNVACVRQWQFNNTQRPGSEEVGQEYGLSIESFGVNDGFPLDIANRRAEDRVPVDFSVYNPRHGLKGIEARNVAYKIGVYDNVGSLTDKPKCQTGWIPLGGEFADNDFGENGTILPGGFATPLGTHSELTLRGCDLLQPALGIKRRVRLQLAYDYSSQSTLQVQAMSRDNMLSLEQRPSFKKSQTADTPVKTYINVESPITYRINEESGVAESSVFGLRVGFETGQKDVRYRVHTEGFKLYDSGETIDVEKADSISTNKLSCEDLNWEDDDQYTFSRDMTDYLNERQSGSWFASRSGPSPTRCSMVLENPGSISSTGETLTFRVDANYTVLLDEVATGFKVQNSQCTRFECPMLVPQSHEDAGEDGLFVKCDSSNSVDANDGCGARQGEDWRHTKEDYALNDELDSKIEEGEKAVKWKNILNVVNEEMPVVETKFEYKSDEINDETVVGVDLSSYKDLRRDQRFGFIGATGSNGDAGFGEVDYKICQSEDDLAERYPEHSGYGNRLIFASIYKVDCKTRIEEKYGFDWSECFTDSYSEYIQTVTGWNLVVEGNLFDNSPESCRSAVEAIPKCDSGIRGWDPDQSKPVCIS